jgi:hypothetical protein
MHDGKQEARKRTSLGDKIHGVCELLASREVGVRQEVVDESAPNVVPPVTVKDLNSNHSI